MRIWFVACGLILLDAGLTLYAINVRGFWEVNPLMRDLPAWQFVGFKLLTVAAVLALGVVLRQWRRINLASGASTIGLYGAVVGSNIWELAR